MNYSLGELNLLEQKQRSNICCLGVVMDFPKSFFVRGARRSGLAQCRQEPIRPRAPFRSAGNVLPIWPQQKHSLISRCGKNSRPRVRRLARPPKPSCRHTLSLLLKASASVWQSNPYTTAARFLRAERKAALVSGTCFCICSGFARRTIR